MTNINGEFTHSQLLTSVGRFIRCALVTNLSAIFIEKAALPAGCSKYSDSHERVFRQNAPMNHVWNFLGLVKSKWIFGAVERAEHRRRTFDEFRTPTQGTRRDELKISGANSCMRVENPIDTALNHERRGISRNFYHSIQKSERCPNFGRKKLDIKMWNMWIARQILTRALPNPIYNLIWEYSRLFHSKPRSRPNKTSAPRTTRRKNLKSSKFLSLQSISE